MPPGVEIMLHAFRRRARARSTWPSMLLYRRNADAHNDALARQPCDDSFSDLCRRNAISTATFYRFKRMRRSAERIFAEIGSPPWLYSKPLQSGTRPHFSDHSQEATDTCSYRMAQAPRGVNNGRLGQISRQSWLVRQRRHYLDKFNGLCLALRV